MVMLSLLAKYRIGQKITFTKPGILKNKTFKIVGFVKVSEFLDKNQIGQTNIGSGRLTGIAVTTPSSFASPVYQVSRVTFKNTQKLSPFSVTYRNRVYHDQGRIGHRRSPKDQTHQHARCFVIYRLMATML